VLDVGVERVCLPNGEEVELEIVRHPGAAAVLPVSEDGTIVLLEQFRHAADQTLWEIPAGTREPGESARACAERELEEEAGLHGSSWVDLGEMLPAPGYTSERIQLFLARGLHRVGARLERDEVIVGVRSIPVREVLDWISQGVIVDAKSVVAICRANARGLLSGTPA
jgi:ADP-ribose pyrophosphatase